MQPQVTNLPILCTKIQGSSIQRPEILGRPFGMNSYWRLIL
jgi:hypothetical protein